MFIDISPAPRPIPCAPTCSRPPLKRSMRCASRGADCIDSWRGRTHDGISPVLPGPRTITDSGRLLNMPVEGLVFATGRFTVDNGRRQVRRCAVWPEGTMRSWCPPGLARRRSLRRCSHAGSRARSGGGRLSLTPGPRYRSCRSAPYAIEPLAETTLMLCCRLDCGSLQAASYGLSTMVAPEFRAAERRRVLTVAQTQVGGGDWNIPPPACVR